MKVFVFDLLAYGEQLEHLKVGNELPYPLPKRYFKPKVAARTYAEHLEAWEELDRLGYDGVGFNEHHCSPYGLMNSPNLLAAAAAQRTKRLKLLIYGNLLPLHQPLRLAEELAMLDCLSNGRLISGFARGIPREYQVHNVPLSQSRARFEEAFAIIRKAWTEEVFSYKGDFWSYKDVAIWPRPLQQPHPPIWMPIVGSKESIEFAARHNLPITPGLGRSRGLRDDIIRYYARCLAQRATGSRPTTCPSASAPMSPTARPRRCGRWGRTTSISIEHCSATATSPKPSASGKPAMRAPRRPITSVRRTGVPPNSPARTSAT
jgi:alkanesulfonate monooxygenase SsuD/methylene tetrahydromethanopterin reductase-like flavin-dependent oxidoreductase (luciferase family)